RLWRCFCYCVSCNESKNLRISTCLLGSLPKCLPHTRRVITIFPFTRVLPQLQPLSFPGSYHSKNWQSPCCCQFAAFHSGFVLQLPQKKPNSLNFGNPQTAHGPCTPDDSPLRM